MADKDCMGHRLTFVCSLGLLLTVPGWSDDNKDLGSLTLEQLMDIKVEGAAGIISLSLSAYQTLPERERPHTRRAVERR